MKKYHILQCCLTAILLLLGLNTSAATWMKAGPYLQEVTADQATIVFENSIPTFSWVEVRLKGSTTATKYYQDLDGQHQIYNEIKSGTVAVPVQNFVIQATDLANATTYEYRICAQQIVKQYPYSCQLGDSYESDWYTFTTLDANATEHHLLVANDMHNNATKLETLLKAGDYATADHIIFAGDIMDNMQLSSTSVKSVEEPYGSFINKCISLFATSKAFDMLRGDCETQGDIAFAFEKYFPHNSKKLYNAYRWGDLEVVFLDGGDAKADDDPLKSTSNNLGMYSPYREEEANWLEALIKTEEYQSARYRVVVCHFPIPNDKTDADDAGTTHMEKLMLPLLNKGNVNLVISGHSQPDTYVMQETGTKDNKFPCLIQGGNTITRVDIADGKLNVSIVNESGTKVGSYSLE